MRNLVPRRLETLSVLNSQLSARRSRGSAIARNRPRHTDPRGDLRVVLLAGSEDHDGGNGNGAPGRSALAAMQ